MGKSRYPITALVLLLILSFALTPVMAAAEPTVQPGSIDGDGDLVVDVLPGVDIKGPGALPGVEDVVFPAAFADWETNIIADPAPVYPVDNEYIFTKLPEFTFTENPDATKYRIEVFNTAIGVPVYSFKGNPACNAGECSLQPTTALKYYTIFEKGGWYAWRVEAKVGGSWQGYSTPATFLVLKTGFESTFSALDPKWLPVYGTWSITSAGTLKTGGVQGYFSSVIEKHGVSDGFVYEVTTKRKDGDETITRIYFQGSPYDDDGNLLGTKDWYNGYFIEYTDSPQWELGKTVDGVDSSLIIGFADGVIHPYDWNTVTVMVANQKIDVWINAINVGSYSGDTSFDSGFVGIGMYKSSATKTPLQVDSAELYYTNIPPY